MTEIQRENQSENQPEIQAVLFDMGGVLVRLDSLADVLAGSALESDKIWDAWILSGAVQEFETGRCDVHDFADRMVVEMQLRGSADEFLTRFEAFPQGLFPGVVEMIDAVPDHITTGILSNTNGLHWDHQQDATVIRNLCDHAYLSYEIGLAKPHREIYDYVVADLNLPAERVLFIDDNLINVEGARAAGLSSAVAKGPDQARGVLRDFGVIA